MALLQPGETLSGILQEDATSESLGHWLVRKWCYGKLSAHDAVQGAQSALVRNAKLDDDLIQRLARINEHNAHRDLVRFLQRQMPDSHPPMYRLYSPLCSSRTCTKYF